MTSNSTKVNQQESELLKDADKLLLMSSEKQKIIKVLISDDTLIFDGYAYKIDPVKFSQMKRLNEYRINNGDGSSSRILKMVIKNYGLTPSLNNS